MAQMEMPRTLYNYTFLKKIGKGSYGEVWLATYTDTKKYVVKKIKIRHAPLKELQAARQECQLLSQLNHPNIVNFKDSFEDDGYLYIAMGYCENGDLYHRLKDQKGDPLEERQIGEWLVQITMGLQYLHQRNILHRDLKTQNIFLTRTHLVKLGDLGISRVLNSSEDLATTVIGTPYYMSPELFSNKPYNHKSDIWALGCCTFEMASLKHAFNAQNFTSLSYKILTGKIPDIPDYYSNELNAITRQMLHQDPSKRPSVSQILKNSYIRNHIKAFLQVTETKSRHQRRPSSFVPQVHSSSNSRPQSVQQDKISPSSPPRVEYVPRKDIVGSRKEEPNRRAERVPSVQLSPPRDVVQKHNPSVQIESPRQPMKVTILEQTVREQLHDHMTPPNDGKDDGIRSPSRRGDSSPDDSREALSKLAPNPADESDSSSHQQPSRQDRLNSNARARQRALRQLRRAEKGTGGEESSSSVRTGESDVSSASAAIVRRRIKPSLSSPVSLPQLMRPSSSRVGSAVSVTPLKTPSSGRTSAVTSPHQREEPEGDFREIKEFIQEMNATLRANKSDPRLHSQGSGGGDTDSEAERGPTEQAAETISRTTRFNRNMVELQKECMKVLGHPTLRDAFKALEDVENEEHELRLRQILGKYFDAYVGKIYQLKIWDQNSLK